MFFIQLCYGSVIQVIPFWNSGEAKGSPSVNPNLRPMLRTHCWASHDCQNRCTMGKPGRKTRVSAKPVAFEQFESQIRQTSDQASTVSRSSRTTWVEARLRPKRWAETNFQNHPLTKHISTLNQLRVLLDLSPNRWIAHPRSAQNAVSCGMYLDLVPNDKKVGNKNLHHLQRKGCFLHRHLTVDKIFLKKKPLAQCAWTKPCSWHLIFETSESWLNAMGPNKEIPDLFVELPGIHFHQWFRSNFSLTAMGDSFGWNIVLTQRSFQI